MKKLEKLLLLLAMPMIIVIFLLVAVVVGAYKGVMFFLEHLIGFVRYELDKEN